MRIISQSGMVDLPYELLGVNIWDRKDPKKDAFCVYAHSNSLNAKAVIMAEYSSQEKARKSLEMLRNVYYESELSKISNDGTSFLTTHFQFPADDEIEV